MGAGDKSYNDNPRAGTVSHLPATPMSMLSYCQRDPAWAQDKLPPSELTIGRYGCTTTCIADLSTYFGDNLNPAQMAQTVKYTPQGLILWASCTFPHFKFIQREYGQNNAHIRQAIEDPNLAVILQVGYSHWVVATHVMPDGSFSIADPWFGDHANISRYNGDITGAAYFQRI